MELFYIDESGSTGLDLDNRNQPFFVLAGIGVEDKKWHEINNFFEKEKIRIYPDFKNLEIHTNELFNSNPNSPFYKNYWKDNFTILEKLVDLVSNLDVTLSHSLIYKKVYKKHFGNNIIVDPYLYSFAIMYSKFNKYLEKNNNYGILFCDELKSMENSLQILYPRLKIENKNIIEKTFYLDSKKSNFIQIVDICSFYINKYHCITNNLSTMDNFKKEHCLRMYNKISKLIPNNIQEINYEEFDNYFK